MDEQLKKLITEVCCYPDPSPERQKALNRLLMVIQQLPGIYQSGHQDYLEALNQTWEWVSRKVCEFEVRSRSDSEGVSLASTCSSGKPGTIAIVLPSLPCLTITFTNTSPLSWFLVCGVTDENEFITIF